MPRPTGCIASITPRAAIATTLFAVLTLISGVQAGMGADHQRDRADQGCGHRDGASGKVELLYVHLGSVPVPKTSQARAHCLSSAIASLGLRDRPGMCPRIARNLRRRTKQTFNRI